MNWDHPGHIKKKIPKPHILTLREETKQKTLFPVPSSHETPKSSIKITMTKTENRQWEAWEWIAYFIRKKYKVSCHSHSLS